MVKDRNCRSQQRDEHVLLVAATHKASTLPAMVGFNRLATPLNRGFACEHAHDSLPLSRASVTENALAKASICSLRSDIVGLLGLLPIKVIEHADDEICQSQTINRS